MNDMASTFANSGTGLDGNIFGRPNGVAFEGAKLLFGDWLELLFGANTSVSDGGTILTYLAGYTNFMAYVLIVVIMMYVGIAGTIKTASEGKFLGNWSVTWVTIRSTLSLLLIMPIPIAGAGNISLIQGVVARLGLIGSNAADEAAMFVSKNIQRNSFNSELKGHSYSTVQNLTQMAFCAAGFNYADVGQSQFRDTISGASTGSRLERLGFNSPDRDLSTTQIDSNSFNVGYNGQCGQIKVDLGSDYTEEQNKAAVGYVIKQLVKIHTDVVTPLKESTFDDYDSAIKNTEAYKSPTLERISTSSQNLKNIYDNFSKGFYNSIKVDMSENNNPLVSVVNGADNNIQVTINQNVYNKLGWGYLGAYYSVFSSSMAKASKYGRLMDNITEFKNPDGCSLVKSSSLWRSVKGMFASGEEKCDYDEKYSLYKPVLQNVAKIVESSNNVSNVEKASAACSSVGCDANSSEKYIANAFSAPLMGNSIENPKEKTTLPSSFTKFGIGVLGVGSHDGTTENLGFNSNGSTGALTLSDPIAFTSQMGHNLVWVSSALKSVLASMGGVAETLKSSVFTGPVGSFIGGFLSLLIGFWMTLDNIIGFQGAVMAYYIPMLPSLIWGMVFLSWLLMFAEAVINAPMSVVLMATPEGEGIAGARMERVIGLIAALIMKPLFLVIGMVLSLFILSIGFVFLNQIFWISAGQTTYAFDPISIVALLSAWIFLMVTFMHNAFKIIPTFADNSLEWFLGGVARTFGNDLDGGATQSLTQSASSVGIGDGSLGSQVIKSTIKKKGKKDES